MEGITFAQLENGFYLLAPLLYGVFRAWNSYKGELRLATFFNERQQADLLLRQAPWVERSRFVLRLLALLLLCLVAMGPRWGKAPPRPEVNFQELVFLIDVSSSMWSEDVKPSRLEKAKILMEQLLTKLNHARVGLVLFSSSSFSYAPLTSDYETLLFLIKQLSAETLPASGTNLPSGLATALEMLQSDLTVTTSQEKGEGQSLKSTFSPSRGAIILFTDGENHEETLTTVIKKIKQENVVLFSLGIGSERGSVIPQSKSFTANAGPFKTHQKTVVTKLEKETLKELASSTGGKAYFSPLGQAELTSLVKQLSELVGRVFSLEERSQQEEQFIFFAVAGFVCLYLEAWLSTKRVRLRKNKA